MPSNIIQFSNALHIFAANIILMETEGKLIEIFDTKKVTDTFQKREFVVELGNNPNYPETVLFQLVQDKCSLLDGYSVNDSVKVSFDLKGRKWKSPQGELKYFNSLQAWRVSKAGGAEGNNDVPDFPDFDAAPQPPADDDLPF